MTEQNITPDRIEWRRDGYTIWADEDGVHIRITKARGFEMPEAVAMNDLYRAVLDQYRTGAPFAKPVAPTREQRVFYSDSYAAHRAKRAVSEALAAEFDTPADAPF